MMFLCAKSFEMKSEIVRENNKIRSVWSGGTKTQLYIYPSDSLYADRDFDLRISSAVIEVEESDFTPLKGYSRIIMVLEGELEIIHKNQYSKFLNRFDTDSFSGDWETSSKGKVIDFNLMMGEKVSGTMKAIVLIDSLPIRKTIFESENFVAYYVVSGELNFESESIHSIVETGEMIVLKSIGEMEDIKLNGMCELIEICCYISD